MTKEELTTIRWKLEHRKNFTSYETEIMLEIVEEKMICSLYPDVECIAPLLPITKVLSSQFQEMVAALRIPKEMLEDGHQSTYSDMRSKLFGNKD